MRYYEDFIRPLDQSLPSLNLRQFCYLIFQYCPLLQQFSDYHAAAFTEFLAYKTRVPVRGAIMLDQDMEQVVLVKGWKKNASWSFPRGKINKDENDLDCAIRETYEETGYDIRAANLIEKDSAVKYIDVTLREQQLRLYVIRGVPLDTHFEPRTRKEISKIDWYRIADLPGGKKHVTTDNINDQKSKFYMVAPFIGHLKGWIKHQKRQDRSKSGLHAPEPIVVEDSGFETDYVPTHEGLIAVNPPEFVEVAQDTGHLQFLLSRLGQPQETPPPQPSQAAPPTDKLAFELKKLLSIGGSAGVPEQQPPQPAQAKSLLSLLNPGISQGLPQTPIEQTETSPPQAITPHHINNPPQISDFSPPPPFPFHSVADNMDRRRQPFPFANNPSPNYHQQPPPFPHPGNSYHQVPMGAPPPYQALHHGPPHPHLPHHPPPHHFHPQGHNQPTSQPLGQQYNPPRANPVSSPPQQRLNQQNLALLNVFKTGAISNEPHAVSPVAHTLELPSENIKPIGPIQPPNNILPIRPDSSLTQVARPVSSEGQGPRSIQQNTLLGLFRNPAGAQAASAANGHGPPVAELSAGTPRAYAKHSSPKQVAVQKTREQVPVRNDGTTTKSRLTSATVSGPLNAPDFETVARNRPPAELGNGSEHGGSPVPVHTVDTSMVLEAPRPYAPSTILQRQHTPANLPPQAPTSAPTSTNPVPSAVATATFDRRDAQPATQKSALMSLFGSAPTKQAPASAHAQRPSTNASPVSPIPDRRVPVRSHPTTLMGHTSSLGGPTPPAIAPIRSRVSSFEVEAPASTKSQSPITPVDKRFLFQYLEGVVSQKD